MAIYCEVDRAGKVLNMLVCDEAFALEKGYLIDKSCAIGEKYPTIDCVRADKSNSLKGQCSGAIYYGVDIGKNHYNFSEKTQVNLETIARLINEGQTVFLYRADNETEQRIYTAAEMKVIITEKSEWITVNTNYYELLKKWINRETDETVIDTIRYGSDLPSDLMAEIATKLGSVGIDITKYAAQMAAPTIDT